MASFARKLMQQLQRPEVAVAAGALYGASWCYVGSKKIKQPVSPGDLMAYMFSGFVGGATTSVIHMCLPPLVTPAIPIMLASSALYNVYYQQQYPDTTAKLNPKIEITFNSSAAQLEQGANLDTTQLDRIHNKNSDNR